MAWRNAHRYPVHRTSYSSAVRCFMFLKDFFNSSVGNEVPKVGDVVYEDKTFGAASDYDETKRAVGVVAIVSEDARDVTIINLKDLTFSSKDVAGNFNPENPYGASNATIYWRTRFKGMEDIAEIENFGEIKFLTTINPNAPVVTVERLKKSFTEPQHC